MKRNITVSTAVYAAIWKARQEGEETEDAVLRRVFKCEEKSGLKETGESSRGVTDGNDPPGEVYQHGGDGVYDSRNGVRFPYGMKIFRKLKWTTYEATALNGVWVRSDNGRKYPSIHQLDLSITGYPVNVWGVWQFKNESGEYRLIDELRRSARNTP